MQSGLIFDIKRYAINDGPGIRLTVFLKGCPLKCEWCHNPESISPKVQKMYTADKCIGCNSCVEACPQNACQLTPDGIVTDPDLCKTCGICADVCPTGATEMSGKIQSVKEIIEIIEKERIFFDQSGGGVTFSGGEPLMYADFLIELLDACQQRGIHCTVDTSGLTKTETLLDVAKRTDYFLYDLKLMDDERHKKWTGVSNKKILDNLQILAETDASINIRIPLIKNVNDDFENIEQMAEFVAELPGEKRQVNLLAYHNIAERKYQKLGETYQPGEMAEPTKEEQEQIAKKFESFGLKVVLGG
ncbi:MAG: glycyl-radical enzyme activating protein [Calditrichaeota bacterium]|nr:MAG: glycyl-radical enzyme activating protein [Calditrichota bacterium]MBL1204285.1 glycyl-radical enzyme activating protein [Calditrichota bacterium]NOG44115.1 glycyl-radical enzyme activating protein [Calditrichota bacterium]